ncbi:IFI44-like protein [Mya arenaria]|uniref:IFI44-like protein n=1 Tax=Mya arenaria TaxID=6604 RepID=A0ABY7G5R9_MYAAR|nr:IFI44-like protein [Mya arenaria]
MVVTEMEVYAVSGADGKKRHRPWRKCSDFSDEYIKLLTEELAPLRPPNGSDVTNFCLLLIGPISGGKSSFINAVLSAFAGKVIQKVAVGESEQGVTKRLVVILTKIDKLHKDIADDLADVFKHQVVNAAVEKVSEMLGIPPNNVFPVKNYHSEVETEVAVHAFALMALRKLICMASDVLEERTNDSDDRTAGSGEVKESDTA